jgi:Ala-tRNA(Pro) deacylase
MTRPASQEELLAELARLGIESQTVQHPPVFTVDEARTWRGDISGGHTKNLFLTDRKGRLFLAVTLEDVKVDLKALAITLGVSGRFSFASADLLRQHLGVEPGSVTPFALINDRQQTVTALFDETMLDLSLLNFHPLANTATTGISSADLLKFAEAQGHTPLRLRFPQK